MKKIVWLLITALLLTGFVGCGETEKADPSKAPDEVEVTSPETEAPDTLPDIPPPVVEGAEELELTDPLEVMDASVYRGIVTDIFEEDGVPALMLELAEGTMFGPSPIQVNITEDTALNFNLEALTMGSYVEVFHGGIMATDTIEMLNAIAINYLGASDARVFNGKVKEINLLEEDPLSGSFLLEDLDNGNQIVFHFVDDGTTQLYIDLDEVAIDSELNVYFSGAVSASMPPQAIAQEIRPFYQET